MTGIACLEMVSPLLILLIFFVSENRCAEALSTPIQSPAISQSKHYVFQGDIEVPDGAPSDYLPIRKQTQHHRSRRHARRMKQYLWHAKIIPYEIAPSLGKQMNMIVSAIHDFERSTCLKFRRKTYWDENWIRFQMGSYCASSVGLVYWKPGAQNITLGKECLHKQIILHEIMHALGFWHEHSRPDRYKYIEVMWENIREGAEENFERYNNFNSDTLGADYDYKSILHYHNYAYSANNAPTIRVIRSLNANVGSSEGLSNGDILKINTLYDCKAHEILRRQKRSYLSAWSDWSPCDLSCTKYRQRVCFGRRRSFCHYVSRNGVQTQKTVCSEEECYAPVDGHWGRWSQWSSCYVDKMFRTRTCSDPRRRYGGKTCEGEAVQNKMCGNTKKATSPPIIHRCNTALGLESGYFKDENFDATASDTTSTGAIFARLNNDSAWCVPKNGFHKEQHFLKIHLPTTTKITAFAIQGHPDYQSLVTRFRLYYKYGNSWKLYRHEGKKAISQKNFEPRKKQQLIVLKEFVSDYIAINPRQWLGPSPCLRLEIFGCSASK